MMPCRLYFLGAAVRGAACSAVACSLAFGCKGEARSATEGSGARAAEAVEVASTPAPPPRPASARLLGSWRFGSAGAGGSSLGVDFGSGEVRRLTNGVVTSSLVYTVYEESEDSVAIDVSEGSGTPTVRHRWRLLDDNQLVHEATPEIVYQRVAVDAAVGSGATAGSGTP